jgi:hypothetical protein
MRQARIYFNMHAIHLELYRRYAERRPSAEDLGKIMPYGWTNLPDPLFMTWMVYSHMLDDFSRELANAINAFTHNVRKLMTWDALYPEFNEDEQHVAMHEFIDPVATLCLLTPYVIRSRFIYATAHLCHQVNLIREDAWQETSLPVDNDIYFDSADQQGTPWKEYRRLKLRIEAIGGKALQKATAEFRNAFTHRFPPRVGIGFTNFITRRVDPGTGQVSYAFGGAKPLALGDIIVLLIAEMEKNYGAFEAFQKLVAAHEAYIFPHNETALAKIRAGD